MQGEDVKNIENHIKQKLDEMNKELNNIKKRSTQAEEHKTKNKHQFDDLQRKR